VVRLWHLAQTFTVDATSTASASERPNFLAAKIAASHFSINPSAENHRNSEANVRQSIDCLECAFQTEGQDPFAPHPVFLNGFGRCPAINQR
jgi:hypothetical protein